MPNFHVLHSWTWFPTLTYAFLQNRHIQHLVTNYQAPCFFRGSQDQVKQHSFRYTLLLPDQILLSFFRKNMNIRDARRCNNSELEIVGLGPLRCAWVRFSIALSLQPKPQPNFSKCEGLNLGQADKLLTNFPQLLSFLCVASFLR